MRLLNTTLISFSSHLFIRELFAHVKSPEPHQPPWLNVNHWHNGGDLKQAEHQQIVMTVMDENNQMYKKPWVHNDTLNLTGRLKVAKAPTHSMLTDK